MCLYLHHNVLNYNLDFSFSFLCFVLLLCVAFVWFLWNWWKNCGNPLLRFRWCMCERACFAYHLSSFCFAIFVLLCISFPLEKIGERKMGGHRWRDDQNWAKSTWKYNMNLALSLASFALHLTAKTHSAVPLHRISTWVRVNVLGMRWQVFIPSPCLTCSGDCTSALNIRRHALVQSNISIRNIVLWFRWENSINDTRKTAPSSFLAVRCWIRWTSCNLSVRVYAIPLHTRKIEKLRRASRFVDCTTIVCNNSNENMDVSLIFLTSLSLRSI